ncbi:ATP-binding protein [uncultured Psychroserpens sp.]|uniref:ATP-binding protein n=1 Tax=uncultured Psychroserpens sp. TaxID=255436 RepID=UPI00260E620F|nr:P-loop NTPase fold protein [uncultured Psychroserpens sp.]
MSVFVKDIYIQLPEYKFSYDDANFSKFIGRKEELERLKRRIKPESDTNNKKRASYKGAYLITGYRGMGKSTLVKKAIHEVNEDYENETGKKEKLVNEINIYLSQDQLTDYDLLKQLFINLNAEIETIIKRKNPIKVSTPLVALIVLLLLVAFIKYGHSNIYPLLFESFSINIGATNIEGVTNELLMFFVFSIIYTTSVILAKKGIESLYNCFYYKKDRRQLVQKLNQINRRINSGLEVNNNSGNYASSNQDSGSPIEPILNALNTNNNTDNPFKQTFEKLTAKELEFEILKILKLYKEYNGSQNRHLLFVIDELDKLEPEFNEESIGFFELGKSKIQSRRETISKLLANLKSFIHASEAKFIFIGGAEMYDASLADIADRESFYGSIFHEVIYLNSFFRDFVKEKRGLSQMTENYLIRLLLPKHFNEKPETCTLKNYYQFLSNSNIENRDIIIYHLHRFIIYLTYRSNGSPKKLKEFIEYYLVKEGDTSSNSKPKIILGIDSKKKDKNIFLNAKQLLKEEVFLRLEYRQQHKIGLLASIVLPYLINNETHLKIFNDKNLYLSAFLIDHILKFHKSAFSWRELELLPDIIMGSKGPNLRNTLSDLTTYLSSKHIRETTNAMFEYKFRSRSSMELKYISKVSDESAAAFNFTFDESYHLKSFFKRKLRQKIEAYSKDKSFSNDSFIHTISNLNATIADIHFYDEEYDSAIRYYADSIQPIRTLKQQNAILNAHQKILYIRNRLLLSLCLEKMNNYNSAYSIIRSVMLDSNHWVFGFDNKENNENKNPKEKTWEQPYKRMQLFLRPHLSLLLIIEKKRSDGITISNLRKNIDEYSSFMGLVNLFPFKPFNNDLEYRGAFPDHIDGDHKRIETLLADYYQNIGSLLFFKNRNYKSLHELGAFGVWNQFLKIGPLKFPNLMQTSIDNWMKERNFTIGDKDLDDDKKINYLCLSNIRKMMEEANNGKKKRFYFPSFSASFYYITSLNHIVNPYIENVASIFIKRYKNYHDTPFVIESLLFKDETRHVLNGKQKKLLGLITSKLADTILSCIGKVKIDQKQADKIKNIDVIEKLDRIFWGFVYLKEVKVETKNGTKTKEEIYKIPFNTFFSIQSVFYLCLLSSRAYLLAGLYYDALFSLKKCLYIIKTHFKELGEDGTTTSNKYIFVEKFASLIEEKCKKIITKFLEESSNEDHYNFDDLTNSTFSIKDDIKTVDTEEIDFLMKEITFNIKEERNETLNIYNQIEILNQESNLLKNIYTRIQKLRYTAFIRHKFIDHVLSFKTISKIELTKKNLVDKKMSITKLKGDKDIDKVYSIQGVDQDNKPNEIYVTPSIIKELIRSVCELNLCNKNLINIIKTYGYTYIMSYSYMATLYKNIYDCCDKNNSLQIALNEASNNSDEENKELCYKNLFPEYKEFWSFKNMESYRIKAIDFFYKSIGLHSEGSEYRAIIKDMYILEDDFNDSLVHFCAALERSVINTGIIEKKLQDIESNNS